MEFALLIPVFLMGLLVLVSFISNTKINTIDLTLSSAIVTIVLATASLINIGLLKFLIFILIILSSLVFSFRVIKNKSKISMKFESVFSLIVFTYITIVLYLGKIQYKFQTNPDPVIYTNSSGFINRHNSVISGLKSSKNYTGIEYSLTRSPGDDGQWGNVKNAFHIPDLVDRFGVANFNSFHDGGTYFGLFGNFFKDDIKSYFVIWQVMVAISVSLVMGLIYRVSVNLLKSETIRTKIVVSGIIFILFFQNSFVLGYIFEGHLSQLLSTAFILTVAVILIEDLKQLKPREISVFQISILSTATFFCYAQHLAIIMLLILLYLSLIKFKYKSITISITLGLTLILVYSIPLMKYFLNSIYNGSNADSTSYGFFNPMRIFFPSSTNSIIYSSRSSQELSYEGLNQRAVGFVQINGKQLRQSGNNIFADNINLFIVTSIISIIFLLVYVFKSRKQTSLLIFLVPFLILIVFILGYVVINFNRANIDFPQVTTFSQYIFLRLSLLLFYFGSVVMTVTIVSKYFSSKKPSISKLVILSCFVLYSIYFSINYHNNYDESAVLPYVYESCDDLKSGNVLYVGDTIPTMSMGFCGKSLLYLSDKIEIKVQPNSYEIVNFIYSKNLNKYIANPLGLLNLKEVQSFSNCGVSCISMNKDFVRN